MRISCTQLDAFRLFMEPSNEWMTEDDLIRTIKGETVPTPAMLLGRAFEQILESPDLWRAPGGYQCEGYSFSNETMAPALALIDRRGVFQAKTTKRYGDIDVVVKADQILGAEVMEFKTTSSFDVTKYLDSYQWRYTFDAFGALRLRYFVWVLYDHGNGIVEIRESHPNLCVYPYAELHQDCCDLLHEFCTYVTAKGLDGILRERQKAAA